MHYIILGLIQGLTEFLPISSSGHLVIGQYLLGLEISGVGFEIFVHFGTVLAVLLLFKKRIKKILLSFINSITKISSRDKFFSNFKNDPQCKFAWLLVISTIPGALIGYFFNDQIEAIFGSPIIAASMLIITGICLFLTDKFLVSGNKRISEINIIDALFIGIAQAFAIIPGISRSGFTIMMALSRKLDRKFAAEYSFILSIPIIIGASIFKLSEIFYLDINIMLLITSGLTAFLSGYWAMIFFINILINNKLRLFSYYLWIIGIGLIIFILLN